MAVSFEIIPKNLNEQIEFYENKIDEIKKINVMLIEFNYVLPSEKIKQMLYFSKTIRHIKIEIEKQLKKAVRYYLKNNDLITYDEMGSFFNVNQKDFENMYKQEFLKRDKKRIKDLK